MLEKSSKSASPKSTTPMVVRSRRPAPVLVCAKCLKRSDEGRDVKRALKSELKAGKRDGIKPPKLVMTGCFGLCPKKSIVLASGASLMRQEYLLVADRDQVPSALAQLTKPRDT
ncbi:MAG: hypothetical protein JHD07_21205 [Bradyrhizobium sp.]|nr:hypothetical protein [Bradyrhizobium sp.]